MVRLDKNKISIAHLNGEIKEIFDNSDECIEYCDWFKTNYGIKLSADPLYVFQHFNREVLKLRGL